MLTSAILCKQMRGFRILSPVGVKPSKWYLCIFVLGEFGCRRHESKFNEQVLSTSKVLKVWVPWHRRWRARHTSKTFEVDNTCSLNLDSCRRHPNSPKTKMHKYHFEGFTPTGLKIRNPRICLHRIALVSIDFEICLTNSLTKSSLRILKGSYRMSKGGAMKFAPSDSPRPDRRPF
jgi:hypothetical protein